MSQGFLPIPDEFESVIDEDNRLPLEFLPPHWLIAVCADVALGQYELTRVSKIHTLWESSSYKRFLPDANNPPDNCIQVSCPDGTYLCIRITSYNERALWTAPPKKSAKRSEEDSPAKVETSSGHKEIEEQTPPPSSARPKLKLKLRTT